MATRVTSSRLVGRTREQAELQAALRDAAAGNPSIAFVAGESGVGKTRLVSELARTARASDPAVRVLSGDCVQLGTGELPYAPLVAALRPLVRGDDPILAALPPATRRQLADFLPSVGAASAATLPEHDQEAAQGRLFEALLVLFDALTREQPLLLVIEDLHWADRATRAFLVFLARSLCDERILVVGSYRPDELHRRHPMRPVLAELERDARARRIELAPLTHDELGEQLTDILGAAPEPDLLERLWSRSEGNPLFTEELLAAGLDGRGTLPPTLRDALMLRIEELPPATQELLRVLAVGQRLDHAVLADVGDTDAQALRVALRDAIANHILVVDEDERYRFRHALLREVVQDDLLPGERTDLHLTLAAALERRVEQVGPGVYLTSGIAYHYDAGGDQPAAFQAAVRAADAAERVLASGAEADLLERALTLWANVPDPERLAGRRRVDLLIRAARAHESHSGHARAEALLGKALELIDPVAEPRFAASTLERLARVRWASMRPTEAFEAAQQGLDLLAGERVVERARLLGWWAKRRMLQARFREAIEVSREAIELAQEIGDTIAESRGRNALGVALGVSVDVEAGAEQLRRAIVIATAADSSFEVAAGYLNLSDVLYQGGRVREGLVVAREGLPLTLPRSGDRLWLQTAIAEMQFAVGEWDDAERGTPPIGQPRSANSRLNVLLRHAELALGRGHDDRARELLALVRPLAEESAEPQFLGPAGQALAELAVRAGDFEAARQAVDAAIDRIAFCADDVQRMAHVAAAGVAVEADAAQRARDLGDADGGLDRALARAAQLAEYVRAAAASGRPVEVALRTTVEAELARAHGRPDPAAWTAAEAAWTALEYPYPAARARWRAAEAQLLAGDRAAATASVCAALDIARELGAGHLIGELEGLAVRGRLRLDDPEAPTADAPGNATPAPAEDPFGLTPRERQVLRLVAGGATNREVGGALFMAEKTASVHVSRILAKLDVRSRTEAAAVAHRLGLADDEPSTA